MYGPVRRGVNRTNRVIPWANNSLHTHKHKPQQAKFSYKLPQDLSWNSSFAPCVGARHRDGGCVVDLTRFHATRPLLAAAAAAEPAPGSAVRV
jgi:hypothetical protein